MDGASAILNIYEDLIARHLVPSQVLAHLVCFLEGERVDSILHTEKTRGTAEASYELMSALNHCSKPGWYQGFITGLKEAEFDFIVEIIEGHVNIENQEIFKNLLHIFYSNLTQDVEPGDVIPHLLETKTISIQDAEDISKIENRNIACFTLLRRVASKTSQWFPHFIHALKEANYYHLVETIEPEFTQTHTLEDTERKAEVIPQVNALIGPNTNSNLYVSSPGSSEILDFSGDSIVVEDSEQDDYDEIDAFIDLDSLPLPDRLQSTTGCTDSKYSITRYREIHNKFSNNDWLEEVCRPCPSCKTQYNNMFSDTVCQECLGHGYYNWSKSLPLREKPPIEEVLEEPPAIPPRSSRIRYSQSSDQTLSQSFEAKDLPSVSQNTQSYYEPFWKKQTGTTKDFSSQEPPKYFIEKNFQPLKNEHVWAQHCDTTQLPHNTDITQSVHDIVIYRKPPPPPPRSSRQNESGICDSKKYWTCQNIQMSDRVVCLQCNTKKYPYKINGNETVVCKHCDSFCHQINSNGNKDNLSSTKPQLASYFSVPNMNSINWSLNKSNWCQRCGTKYYEEYVEGSSLQKEKMCSVCVGDINNEGEREIPRKSYTNSNTVQMPRRQKDKITNKDEVRNKDPTIRSRPHKKQELVIEDDHDEKFLSELTIFQFTPEEERTGKELHIR